MSLTEKDVVKHRTVTMDMSLSPSPKLAALPLPPAPPAHVVRALVDALGMILSAVLIQASKEMYGPQGHLLTDEDLAAGFRNIAALENAGAFIADIADGIRAREVEKHRESHFARTSDTIN